MFRVTGEAEQAKMRNEQALAGLDARLGRDHDISLVIALNLASDLAELGEIGAARTLGEDTLHRVKKVLGATHPLTLAAAANLSLDLKAAGAKEAATEPWGKRCAAMRRHSAESSGRGGCRPKKAAGLRLRSSAAVT